VLRAPQHEDLVLRSEVASVSKDRTLGHPVADLGISSETGMTVPSRQRSTFPS
jgi:hypothetical protein